MLVAEMVLGDERARDAADCMPVEANAGVTAAEGGAAALARKTKKSAGEYLLTLAGAGHILVTPMQAEGTRVCLDLVGSFVTALAVLLGLGRLHRAVWVNHRYWFTTWRWGKVLASMLLIGAVMKLLM